MPAAKETQYRLVTNEIQPLLDDSQLPLASDPDVFLDQGNEAEYEQTWWLNASEWKGFLSEAEYMEREVYLGSAEMVRDGKALPWILTSPKLPISPDGSRPILAACETNLKNAYVARGGNVEKVLAHGIGSVCCRMEYRGKGYGVKMIRELATKLETLQQLKSTKGKFSVLFSDIGTKFYAKHGWHAFPSTHISLKPLNETEYKQKAASQTKIEDLRFEDLPSLPLVAELEAKLARMSASEPNKTFVSFRPETAQFEWHFMREEFLAGHLGDAFPEVKGAIDRETGVALIWGRTHGANRAEWHLNVLYVHVPHEAESRPAAVVSALSALLLRAQFEAHLSNMAAGVEMWDPSDAAVEAARTIADDDVVVVSRDQEHICCLRWTGPETEEVVWVAKEKYVWC